MSVFSVLIEKKIYRIDDRSRVFVLMEIGIREEQDVIPSFTRYSYEIKNDIWENYFTPTITENDNPEFVEPEFVDVEGINNNPEFIEPEFVEVEGINKTIPKSEEPEPEVLVETIPKSKESKPEPESEILVKKISKPKKPKTSEPEILKPEEPKTCEPEILVETKGTNDKLKKSY